MYTKEGGGEREREGNICMRDYACVCVRCVDELSVHMCMVGVYGCVWLREENLKQQCVR